jgi:hypothetical protein
MSKLKLLVKYAALILILFLIRLVIHEAGHILTALIFKAKITNIIIMPGLRLYPNFEWLAWQGMGGAVDYSLENGTPFKSGLITLMGSGLPAIIGYLIMLMLFIMRIKRSRQIALLLLSLICFWDIIAYSILPEFGLRHWIIIGGKKPEPMMGAIYLGLNYSQYQLCLMLHVLLSNVLVILYLLKLRAEAKGQAAAVTT